MKRIFSFCSVMSFLFMLIIAASCKKQNTFTPCTHCGDSEAMVTIPATNWANHNGDLIFTFTVPNGSRNVYVINENFQQSVGSAPINYLGGELSLTIYGTEAVLTFSNGSKAIPQGLVDTKIRINM